MKEAQQFISEHEAVQLTGLSATTLKSFVEAGYLHPEADADGLRLFSHAELTALFGSPLAPSYPDESDQAPQQAASDSIAPATSTPVASPAPTPAVAVAETAPVAEAASTRSETSLSAEAAPIPGSAHPLSAPVPRDTDKLRIVVEVQEKLLQSREQEIASLREERSWLRQRIEKLEEKGARDQVILLSETQALREMVQSTVGRRSTMRNFLEFLGVVPPEPNAPIAVQRQSSTERRAE